MSTPLLQDDPSASTSNGSVSDADHQTVPSSLPSTTGFQHTGKSWFLGFEPPRSKPLIRGFERPSLSRIAILAILCIITYPVFYALTFVAKDRSLFIVRVIVSVWCSGGGFALGYILLKIGARHVEAATWATVIHMSREGDGMKLRDLASSSSNPTSFIPAFHIFRYRFRNRETSRGSRKSYDKHPWSLLLGFFLVLAILAPLLPFLFGRIMVINTFISNQSKVYHEVLIAGDLSKEDLDRATYEPVNTLPLEEFPQIWPTSPYGGGVSNTAEFIYGKETVYFAQPSLSQFIPGGSGAGTFNSNQSVSIGLKDTPNNTLPLIGRNGLKSGTGVVLRYPQWGVRIHCEKLPNPEVNLLPQTGKSNYTYAFIPQVFLRGLFGAYRMDLPTAFTMSSINILDNITDAVPSNINTSTISHIVRAPDDGRGVVIDSVDSGLNEDQEWTTVETVLIRLNADASPSSRFPVYFTKPDYLAGGAGGLTGYDVAVCVQKFEPWIIETYNASIISPSALRIIEKVNGSTTLSPSGNIQGAPIPNTGYLNTTGKTLAFWRARYNSIGVATDNSWNSPVRYYFPSPAAVSFTEGTGPNGYIELSPDRFASVHARASAAYALPYLVGSGPVVAKAYEDVTLAYVTFEQWQLISLPVLILILGVVGELFVPALPLNIPRREFGVYSWLALFQSQELQFEAADDLEKLMDLDGLEEKFSDKRVKFVV